MIMSLIYLVWLFLGIMMASQWIWFAAMFGLSFLSAIMRKIFPDLIMKWYKNLDGAVTIAMLLYVCLNHFHS